jgi:hypothetical protein
MHLEIMNVISDSSDRISPSFMSSYYFQNAFSIPRRQLTRTTTATATTLAPLFRSPALSILELHILFSCVYKISLLLLLCDNHLNIISFARELILEYMNIKTSSRRLPLLLCVLWSKNLITTMSSTYLRSPLFASGSSINRDPRAKFSCR